VKSLEIEISEKDKKRGELLPAIALSAVGAATVEVASTTLEAVAASFPEACLGAMDLNLERRENHNF